MNTIGLMFGVIIIAMSHCHPWPIQELPEGYLQELMHSEKSTSTTSTTTLATTKSTMTTVSDGDLEVQPTIWLPIVGGDGWDWQNIQGTPPAVLKTTITDAPTTPMPSTTTGGPIPSTTTGGPIMTQPQPTSSACSSYGCSMANCSKACACVLVAAATLNAYANFRVWN